MRRWILLLLMTGIILIGVTACTSEPVPDIDDAEDESMLEESVPELPVNIGLPPEYAVADNGTDRSRQYVFESEGRDIAIDVTLSDDPVYRDTIQSAIADRNASEIKNDYTQNLAQPETNFARLNGYDAIYITGITNENERVLRYVLVTGEYVVDLYGVADENSLGLLQRHLEEVIGALEEEGAVAE